jgi:plasmid stability protein
MYRSLSVRRLDEDTYEQLRLRALRHGRSMEEEARQILKRAVSAPKRVGDLFLNRFGPEKGIELILPAREPHEPSALVNRD